MFTILPESRARRSRRLAGTVASLLVHGALAAGAVALTMSTPADATIAPPTRPDSIVYVVPAVLEQATHGGPAESQAPPRLPSSALPAMPSLSLGALPLPVDVVTPVPAVTTDFGDRRPSGVETGGSVPPVGQGGDVVVGSEDADRAPRLLGTTRPRYPEGLRAAGITGRVVMRFVVDSAGLAEPSSIEVLSATRPEFAEAVRAALGRFRFVAGELGGRRVRTRVQMPFDFTLQ